MSITRGRGNGTADLYRQESPQNLPGNFNSMPELQAFNIKRKYSVGFDFTTSVGIQNFPGIQFPGTARMLLGFSMFDTSLDPSNKITINMNNENIITNASWANYTVANQFANAPGQIAGSSFNGEYYPYPRALSGTDGVAIQYNATTAGKFFILFFYKSELNFNVL